MVTITLHCVHCGSDALVRDGHAPNGKQKYRCHACGYRSRENSKPNAYPEARREEILHAYQERRSLRGLTRTFGISRTTVSSWIKKKELNFHLFTPPCSPRTQQIPLPRRWNWTNGWLICAQKSAQLLDLDCSLSQDASSGELCDWGSEQTDVSTLVGGYSRHLSCWSLFHRFLGSISGSAPGGTAPSRREGNRGNSSCRALE
jgi:DNA-directed RNA polymerase subunit RPC12/RpoP